MKVLFAFNNEKNVDQLVKFYKDNYGEKLQVVKVYFFRSLIDTLRKDKDFDRIIIHEDLEPSGSKNQDLIDKYLFTNLDKASDESGKADIIVVCGERRQYNDNFVKKLFNLGIYNFLCGQDRTLGNLSELINRPWTKKDAKLKIDADLDENPYESSDKIDEMELRNIIKYYEKNIFSTEKIVNGFDSLYEQYTFEKLKQIVPFLPIKAREVLEQKSQKYISLMSYKPSKGDKNGKIRVVEVPVYVKEDIKKPDEAPVYKSESDLEFEEKQVKLEQERIEKERAERERLEKERLEKERLEKERAEKERLEKERLEKERAERERLEKERAEKERLEKERAEKERLEKEKATNDISVVEMPRVEVPKMEVGRKPETVIQKFGDIYTTDSNSVLPTIERSNKIAEEEAKRLAEVQKRQQEEEARRLAEEERKQEEEAKRLAEARREQEEKRRLEEAKRKQEEEDKRFIEEEKKRQEEEAKRLAEEEKKRQEEEAKRLAEEEKKRQEEEAKHLAEEEKKQQEEEAKRLAEEEKKRQEEEAKRLAEEEKKQQEEEAKRLAEAQKKQQEEEVRRLAEVQKKQQEEKKQLDEMRNKQAGGMSREPQIIRPSISQTPNQQPSYAQPTKYPPSRPPQQEGPIIQTVTQVIEKEIINYDTPRDYKKVACFIGAHKTGTTFIINGVANFFANRGVKVAILDLTDNKDSYLIYTNRDIEQKDVAANSLNNLAIGQDRPFKLGNLSIYTGIPRAGRSKLDIYKAIEIAKREHSVVLIDCGFSTKKDCPDVFRYAQSIYVVQDMDMLNILPMTMFLKELKYADVDVSKISVIINKYIKSSIKVEDILGSLAYYTTPDFTVMEEGLLPKNPRSFRVPFDEQDYLRYIENINVSKMNFSGFSEGFKQAILEISQDIFPIGGGRSQKNQEDGGFIKGIFKRR